MVMTLTLIKGCPVNGTSTATNKATLDAQISYFNSFPFHTYTVNTARLGEPIRLKASLSEIMGYNYGWIDYGDGFYYFLSVSSVSMITETQTEITYSVDAYETLCNQGDMSITRAYMTKYPIQRGDVHLPTEPYFWRETVTRERHKGCTFMGIASVQGTNGSSRPLCFLIPIPNDYTLIYTLDMSWLQTLKLPAGSLPTESDFYICAICPFLVEVETPAWIRCDDTENSKFPVYYRSYDFQHYMESAIGFTSISSSLYERGVIKDMRGNVVWECPIDKTYTVANARLVATATAVTLSITLVNGADYQTATIPCELMDVFVDSWREYLSRQRDSDKALRQLGYESGAWQSGVSSLTGGINGAMSGSLAGASAGLGAIAGIGLGVASSLGSYAINLYYDPKYQEQYDRQAKRENDVLSLSGGASLYMFYNNYAGAVTVVPDERSKEQFDKEALTYGYSTALYLDSDPRLNNGTRVTGPMRGAVDITANAPSEWIDQIAQRFNAGIRFVG